jgi:hypothetical protein
MKKALIILFLVSLSSCYITEPTGYIDYRQRRMYDWDPIYVVPGYIDPFFYRREPPIIIYRDRPIPRQPQQPRRNAFGPTSPPSAPKGPRTAPIREFPRKKISDFKD